MDKQEELTAQQVYDTVKAHLLKQGSKSVGDKWATCLYRGPSGRMCAVGCLIRDDEYDESMEGQDVGSMVSLGLMPNRLVAHRDLLAGLQSIHDHEPVRLWLDELQALALRRGLTP